MERREPTLSTGAISEQPEPRRQQSYERDDDHDTPVSRPARKPTPQSSLAYAPAPSSSLPAIALVVALVAVAGAGFFG